MAIDSGNDLETQFAEWRRYMGRRRAVCAADVDELEDHLRTTMAELVDAGLRTDEAFLVAVKRMGSQDELSREFARVHSERLWKQLVLAGGPEAAAPEGARRNLVAALGCAAVAAIGIKVPVLFGLDFSGHAGFYQRNFAFFALVPLAAYLGYRRRVRIPVIGVLAALFVVAAVGANAYPLAEGSQSIVLTDVHLPLALWLVVGVA